MLRIALFLAVFLTPLLAHSQWEQLPGPYGGLAYSFSATDGSPLVYAATENGVYRSLDAGVHWSPAGFQDSASYEVMNVGIQGSGSVVFARNYGGIFRSIDSGRSWSKLSLAGYQLAQKGNYIFAFKSGPDSSAGVYRSSNLGETWDQLPLRISGNYLQQILSGGPYLWALGYDATTIYSSGTSGSNWTLTGYPQGNFVRSLTYSGTTLIAGVNGGVAISTDQGANWIFPPNAGIDSGFAVNEVAANGLTIIVRSLNHVYLSRDGARSWILMDGSHGLPKANNIQSLQNVNGKFFLGCSTGIYTSVDGLEWINSSSGENAATISDAISFGGTLFALTEQGVSRSLDHGITWIEPRDGLDLKDSSVRFFVPLDGNLYLTGNGLWEYRETGWITISDQPILHVTENSGTWFASSGSKGVSISTDKGINWVFSNNGLPTDIISTDFVFPAFGKIFAETQTNDRKDQIYASVDDGANWNLNEETGFGGAHAYAPSALGPYVAESSGLFHTTDGLIWIKDTSFSQSYITMLAPFNNGVVAGQYQNSAIRHPGLYFTANGITWLPESQTIYGISSFTSDAQYAYIGTSMSGLWRAKTSDLGVKPEEPISTEALKVYPNPVSDIATVQFKGSIQMVELAIYDERGGLVRRSEARPSTVGSLSQIQIDIRDLPSGAYNLVLSEGGRERSAKLIVEHR